LSNSCHMLCNNCYMLFKDYNTVICCVKKLDMLCKIRQHMYCNEFFWWSPEDGHMYCISLMRIAFYHWRVWKLATSLLVLRHYELLFLFAAMLILHVTLSRFSLYLLKIYHFTYTFSHAHTEEYTYKHKSIIKTQEELRQPGTGAWLRGAEERLLLETKALHIHKRGGGGKTKCRYSRI